MWIREHERSLMIPGMEDQLIKIKRGVPQGSILAPFCFNMFYDSLLQKLQKEDLLDPVTCPGLDREWTVNTLSFADDCKLFAHSEEDMRKLVGVCVEWGKAFGMKFNGGKSEGCTLGYGKKELEILMGDDKIPWKTQLKILGCHLNQNSHDPVQKAERIEKLIGRMFELEMKLGPKSGCCTLVASQIMKQIVYPTMLYWSAVFRVDEKQGEKLLNKATKVVIGGFKTSSGRKKREFLGWHEVESCMDKRMLKLDEKLGKCSFDVIREFYLVCGREENRKRLHWFRRLDKVKKKEKVGEVKAHMCLRLEESEGWIVFLFEQKCFNPEDVCRKQKECCCKCYFCGKEGGDNGKHCWKEHQGLVVEEGKEMLIIDWNKNASTSRRIYKRMRLLWKKRKENRETAQVKKV
jgi:hypothetical protein